MSEKYYEQERLWDRDLVKQPDYREKIDVFFRMIPPGTRTILDVGCGNGAITNILAERYDVVGFDRSETALRHVRCRSVRGSADALPFPDRSFDLVLSSEMLEHLPAVVLPAAAAEIVRVSGGHILISVPNEEDLSVRMARCPRCGGLSHVYDHLHRFDARTLCELFAPCRPIEIATCGLLVRPDWPEWLLRFRQRVLGIYWNAVKDQFPMCTRCGNQDFAVSHPAYDVVGRAVTEGLYRLLVAGKPGKRDWLVVLLAGNSVPEGRQSAG